MITASERTLRLLDAQVGRHLSEVETPVAVVDLDRVEGNLARLQAYAAQHGITLWPHTKTHKCVEIGRMQLAHGAGGLTVAKTGEAEVFAEGGAPRILMHYPPSDRTKAARLARLAAEGLELTVAVDSLHAGELLSAELGAAGATAELLVELDVGLHRTGQPTVAGAVAVGQALGRLPHVEVAGISSYPGHCRGSAEDVHRQIVAAGEVMREARDAFAAAGLRSDRVSGGSTPTRYHTHETPITELRSGTYALCDRNDPADGGVDLGALWIEVTVISDAVPDQVVIDCGTKTLTSDSHADGANGGIVGMPEARLRALNEEHGYLDVSRLDERPRLGDRLQVIPNHACGCVNLHDGLLAVRNGVVEQVLRVAARGLIR